MRTDESDAAVPGGGRSGTCVGVAQAGCKRRPPAQRPRRASRVRLRKVTEGCRGS